MSIKQSSINEPPQHWPTPSLDSSLIRFTVATEFKLSPPLAVNVYVPVYVVLMRAYNLTK